MTGGARLGEEMMNRGAGAMSAARGNETTTISTQTGLYVTGTSVVLLTCHTHAGQSPW